MSGVHSSAGIKLYWWSTGRLLFFLTLLSLFTFVTFFLSFFIVSFRPLISSQFSSNFVTKEVGVKFLEGGVERVE